jgi:predicted esterase
VRADQVLSQLMDAYEHGDLTSVEAFARQLEAAHPEVRAWTAYVLAGCLALGGDPDAGLRLLLAADERGEWWSPPLLEDPALGAIWPLDRTGLRSRSEQRWRAEQERAEVGWDVVAGPSPPRAAVIALHGNGPAPAHLFGPLWAELDSCTTFLPRSPQLVTPGVYEWRDRQRAIADLRTVASAALSAVGPGIPLVLAGLGAGGRIAIEAALTGAVDAAGAMAFAPHLVPLDDAPPPGPAADGPRIWIFPGGAEPAVTSCTVFAEWARARGHDCTIGHEQGMGHEYPTRFRAAAAPALEAILAGSRRTVRP